MRLQARGLLNLKHAAAHAAEQGGVVGGIGFIGTWMDD
jgi:hypothetical protein